MNTSKYKAGSSDIFIEDADNPINTKGSRGYWDNQDGIFIEWGHDGYKKIVLRKNGKDYKQSFDEFIKNSETDT